VLIEVFPENQDGSWTKHVDLGLWADGLVIAPATANTIAKLANGFCDSMLTATVLSARSPVLVCPAMDHDMWAHPATKANVDRLRSFGYTILDPEHGELASGLIGVGRLPEPETIAAFIGEWLEGRMRLNRSLEGKKVLVTAGPTREAIDPVRFLSNGSTGTMGFALAEVAARRGADVVLIAGPVDLPTPTGVERVDILTADDLHREALSHVDADLVIAAAAVADYAPATASEQKTKKMDEDLVLQLRRTPDVLAALGEHKQNGQVLVGFALETQNGEANARGKLDRKNLDWVVLNHANEDGAGFGTRTNRVVVLGADGSRHALPMMDKAAVAARLLDIIATQKTSEE
jgi:phosphopantothenoylcysteine decarboxylase/phosphopantothenate--cysteine ligase